MRDAHILHLPAGTEVAGFVVGALLGAGGCGAVYRAVRGGEEVALKLQSLRHLEGWPEREGTILLRLRHPNVVGFRACGIYPGDAPLWFYLAMEYVHGRTLQQWVDEENPGARRVAELLRGMARGLAAAHAALVLHRDIKEHNVVVREKDGEAVLVDFGVGDYAGAPRLTHGVLPPGTPRYRSPEALAFRRAREASEDARYVSRPEDDLYALGVVLYWMLTGRHPFVEVETATEVERVISQVPVAPREANARVPLVLSELCMRLVSKHPEERGSASELCASVDAALAGADAGWDEPLCEAHPEVPELPREWPEDDDAALEQWILVGAEDGGPPRRGRRPVAPLELEVKLPEAAPARLPRARPAPESVARVPVRGFHASLRSALLSGAAVVLACVLLFARTGWVGTPGLEARREMAPPGASPESGPAAMPPQAAPTSAAAAPLAVTAQKEDTPVKKTPETVSPAAPPARSRPGGVLARALTTAAACTALACPGGSQPQVRRQPLEPEPCPTGAVETMKALEVPMYTRMIFSFTPDDDADFIMVQEGAVTAQLGPDSGDLSSARLRGRLFVRGDRVYARFTEGTRRGNTYPVCLSMVDPNNKDGLPREDLDGGPTSARIYSTQRLMAVTAFE